MNKILVTRSSMPPFEEYIDEIKDMWDTHWLTNMGEKHQKLQHELANYLQVNNVALITNGHLALELSLEALGLKGEVITTPFTFASTTHAIIREKLTPVFCDIDSENYTMDVSKIEELITDKTTAIMPVHVYGNVCNVEEIDEIAKKYGLKVIYDAAHAFGVSYKGKGIASYGDISCFSFHATKVFNTIEGGAICHNAPELTDKIYQLKNFGICGPEDIKSVGSNAKIDEFRAAMGICNLRHIEQEIAKRKVIYECYYNNLKDIDGIKINSIQDRVSSNYAYFPVVIDSNVARYNRNDLFGELEKNNIGARKYFYPITSEFECYKHRFDSNKTPVAKHISENILTLPIYSDLDIKVVEEICNIIKKMKV